MGEMKGQSLLLSEFVKEEGFDLSHYINHLFEHFSSLSKNEELNTESTP